MSAKSIWTRDIHATVMKQTCEYLENHSKGLGLSMGEVIDRLVVNIKAPSPDIATTWVCEQFVLTTSALDQDDTREALYATLALFVLPLFQDGIKPDKVWFEVLSRVEDLLSRGIAFPK